MSNQTQPCETSQSAVRGGALQRGATSRFAYDTWGRLATRAQGGYAAEYGYRYGSRLHEATSNFPSEEDVTFVGTGLVLQWWIALEGCMLRDCLDSD
jgi:hypothetical protein